MINKEIVGGVSPLKKKARQSSRGGAAAGAATKTAKQRGGFAKSTGARGAGGRNVGGYNVNTRFKSRAAWTPPGSGGTATIPDPEKPYSYTPDGELVVNPNMTEGIDYKSDPDKVTTSSTRESGGTYNEVWDANKDGFQDEWADKGGKEGWIKEAKKWNEENSETKTEKGKKYSRTYQMKDGVRVEGSESEWAERTD